MIRPALAALALTGWADAATLALPPGAERAAIEDEGLSTAEIAVAPWDGNKVPSERVEGRVTREAWQVPGGGTTLELLAPLRDQLAAEGYAVLLDCETEGCGGFDFRFATEIIPDPEMHVDLADFRFVSARKEAGEGSDAVTLLVSRTGGTGFLQITRVAPQDSSGAPATAGEAVAALPPVDMPRPTLAAPDDIAGALEATGRAVLGDLVFESGSSRLAGGDYPSLDALAGYLKANPGRTVTLVGHTDASGSLTGNIALSRSRARAVEERLTASYGVPGAQIDADGVGYLMPVASNLTEEGRALNRRVEAVLTSTE